MNLLKKIVCFLALFPAVIFYPKYGRKIIRYWNIQGAVWVLNSIWFQKILGFNRRAPFPMHYTSRISKYKNIVVPISTMNSMQAPGIYLQNFSAKIILGENVYIAPNVGLITANHSLDDLAGHEVGKSIIIKDNCWIGMNTVVLPGVELGENTVIGAGSVVTKSFEEGNGVLTGSPVRLIKKT